MFRGISIITGWCMRCMSTAGDWWGVWMGLGLDPSRYPRISVAYSCLEEVMTTASSITGCLATSVFDASLCWRWSGMRG